MASVYRKRGKLYHEYTDETGRPRQEKSPATTKREALQFAHALELLAAKRRAGLADSVSAQHIFRELVHVYLRDKVPFMRARTTIEPRVKRLNTEFGELRLAELSTARGAGRIDAYLSRLMLDERFSAQTVENHRSILRAMFNHAVRIGMMTTSPMARVPRIAVPETPVHFLPQDAVPKFLAKLPKQWVVLFATAVFTGMRKGELLGLRVENVDLANRTIRVTNSYNTSTKSKKARTVAIPDELLPLLTAHLEGRRGYVFPNDDGGMRSKNAKLHQTLRRALKNAGLIDHYLHKCRRKGCGFHERRKTAVVEKCPKCGFTLWVTPVPIKARFHDLRATFATHAYEATGDVRFVQAALGHSSPVLTEKRYSALRNARLVEQANKLRFGVAPYPSPTGVPKPPDPTTAVPEKSSDDAR